MTKIIPVKKYDLASDTFSTEVTRNNIIKKL